MKVFICWSKDESKKYATLLYKYLAPIIGKNTCKFSEEDIEAGKPWLDQLVEHLRSSDVAILCLTPDNYNSPWLLFEAGAIYKGNKGSMIMPLLFGFADDFRAESLGYPLSIFQAIKVNKEGIRQMLGNLLEGSNTKKSLADLLVESNQFIEDLSIDGFFNHNSEKPKCNSDIVEIFKEIINNKNGDSMEALKEGKGVCINDFGIVWEKLIDHVLHTDVPNEDSNKQLRDYTLSGKAEQDFGEYRFETYPRLIKDKVEDERNYKLKFLICCDKTTPEGNSITQSYLFDLLKMYYFNEDGINQNRQNLFNEWRGSVQGRYAEDAENDTTVVLTNANIIRWVCSKNHFSGFYSGIIKKPFNIYGNVAVSTSIIPDKSGENKGLIPQIKGICCYSEIEKYTEIFDKVREKSIELLKDFLNNFDASDLDMKEDGDRNLIEAFSQLECDSTDHKDAL